MRVKKGGEWVRVQRGNRAFQFKARELESERWPELLVVGTSCRRRGTRRMRGIPHPSSKVRALPNLSTTPLHIHMYMYSTACPALPVHTRMILVRVLPRRRGSTHDQHAWRLSDSTQVVPARVAAPTFLRAPSNTVNPSRPLCPIRSGPKPCRYFKPRIPSS